MKDKIDVTGLLLWFVENYPDSVAEMDAHPENLKRFASLPQGA